MKHINETPTTGPGLHAIHLAGVVAHSFSHKASAMSRLIALFALTALTACGQERPAIAKPPVALLSCADEPVAPNLPPRSMQDQRDMMTLEYILGLRSAWGSCKASVNGIAAWANELERK